MTQDQVITLVFRVVLLAVAVSLLGFIGDYSRLTRWGWMHNPIGRTIVIKDLLLLLATGLGILSLFWHFNRFTSHVAAWIGIAVYSLIAVAMVWRIFVFERIHRERENEEIEVGDNGAS